jgi:hypothetical protein
MAHHSAGKERDKRRNILESVFHWPFTIAIYKKGKDVPKDYALKAYGGADI